jgi:ABC-type nitrate/sulfonate/bicarbonate transport system substrate-binding protein
MIKQRTVGGARLAFVLTLLCAAVGALPAQSQGTKLLVQLDWLPNAQYAGLLVAKEAGWYAKAGLDVTIAPINLKTNDPIGPVVNSPAAVGCADGLALLKTRGAGQPIKVFATMLQASPLGIVALKSSGIKRIEDLKGKTIGLHPYDRSQLAILLKPHGLTLADVKVKEIGDDIVSLPAGRIDAQVVYLIDEKVALENKGVQLNVFPGYDNGYLTYSQAYFTRADFLKSHAALLASFLAISNRGWQEAFDQPAKTASMLVAKYLPGGDVEYQRRSIIELHKFATHESARLGDMRAATWMRSASLFGMDPGLARSLPDFSVLKRLYDRD